MNRAISNRPITTQMARFRKFEFIGVPSCPGHVQCRLCPRRGLPTPRAAARRGPCCAFNIGVYRIFAKLGSRPPAGRHSRQAAANVQKAIVSDDSARFGPVLPTADAPELYRKPTKSAEISPSRPVLRPEIDGRHGEQRRLPARTTAPGAAPTLRLDGAPQAAAARARPPRPARAPPGCPRSPSATSTAKRPSHSTLAPPREGHDRQRQAAGLALDLDGIAPPP